MVSLGLDDRTPHDKTLKMKFQKETHDELTLARKHIIWHTPKSSSQNFFLCHLLESSTATAGRFALCFSVSRFFLSPFEKTIRLFDFKRSVVLKNFNNMFKTHLFEGLRGSVG